MGFYTDLDAYLAENQTYQIVVLPDETDGDRLMSVADTATSMVAVFFSTTIYQVYSMTDLLYGRIRRQFLTLA